MTTGNTNSFKQAVLTALALSLGVAISLGMARFSFALLLEPMREDLGWSYTLAGSMNTVNAIGYLAGALLAPLVMKRFSAQVALISGALLTSLFLLLCGLTKDPFALLTLRGLAGAASAFVFVSGGLLTARLGAQHGAQSGLLLGIYYGGAGAGIVLSALLVPWAISQASATDWPHTWQMAWLALAAVCLLCTLVMIKPAGCVDGHVPRSSQQSRLSKYALLFSLMAYFMFGVGYIGYMTFIIALLKSNDMQAQVIILFYTLLGFACMASSRLWAGMLDRFKGGESLAILNGLLGIATLIPTLTHAPFAIFISGMLFGSVFLSVVASTTALVRHNLPPHQWASGIGLFTVIFATGQIIGPSIAGMISDSTLGLKGGLVFSGLALLLGSALALGQKPLGQTPLVQKPHTA